MQNQGADDASNKRRAERSDEHVCAIARHATTEDCAGSGNIGANSLLLAKWPGPGLRESIVASADRSFVASCLISSGVIPSSDASALTSIKCFIASAPYP